MIGLRPNILNQTVFGYIIVTIIAWLIAAPLLAQVIKPEVTLHLERLPLEEWQYLEGVGGYMNRLIENYQWNDPARQTYKYDLPIKIDILFEKYSISGIYHLYSAGVMGATKSGIQLRDTRWDFRYAADWQPNFGDPYDPFTGLIEFYVWLCLGFEGDLLSEHGGQHYYEKARFVAEAARFENKYSLGWDYRRELVRDLCVNEKYLSIRSAAFYAKAGIYYADHDDLENALPHLRKAVELMFESSPTLIRLQRENNILRFIDREKLASALDYCQEQELLERLSRWDSENASVYK